jgi:cephalosporin hydroxylase
LIKPVQVRDEILELLRILNELKPKTVIEIGTAGGGTLFLFCQVSSEDATVISIDLPGGKFGGGYPKWKVPLYRTFKLPKQELHLIRADSHNQETLEKVKNILSGRKVDFLFIDGDHSYEGVKKDFEMYGELVDRVVASHDIVHHPFVPECQVEKFRKEVSQKYKTKETISSVNQTWAGNGIILI